MLPRERVMTVIHHGKPDRIPLYGWLFLNMGEAIAKRFGSVEAFEDKYEFDYAHLFGGPTPYRQEDLDRLRNECGGVIEPACLLQLRMNDPNTASAYDAIKAQVEHHKHKRGRFVYVQTNGIFECMNWPFGIEEHLGYMLIFPDELLEVYRRLADWNRQFAMNCLDLGVDMIHVSDDWGAQYGLMFSPELWWKMIYPNHKVTCDAVKMRKGYISLHSDGNINPVLDGIIKLGYDVVHPYQESAGMSLDDFRAHYRQAFTAMGGIDIQTTLGFGKIDELQTQIKRVIDLFRDGGLMLCTTHFVQNHCSIEELVLAYDLAYEYIRKAK